ncbi:hypothetical protein ACFTSF_35485 [Kribbella sp. NPDC056951]|uniref:hypothetical protein n=1 Tax=Kribbella sp. NPDC056951 TaxID=3345978 RepID=UPI00362820A5
MAYRAARGVQRADVWRGRRDPAVHGSNVDAVVGDWVATRDMYDWQLGTATGRRTEPQSNLHQRIFEHGLVLVNADPETSRRGRTLLG